jgi:hypothetical protein
MQTKLPSPPTVIFFLALALIALPAAGKSRKPSQTPAPTRAAAATPAPAPASLRLWKNDFASRAALRVQIIPVRTIASSLEFHPAKQGASFTDYVESPSGALKVKITDEGNPGAKPLTQPLQLDPGAFVTLVLRELNGAPDLQIINDGPVGLDEADAELTVRNFVPGLSQIEVHSGDVFSARVRANDGCLYFRGLERKVLQLDTSAIGQDGKESKWTTEVNFGKVRKATLLILVDSYGRIRPRVAIDGEPPLTAPPASTTPVTVKVTAAP